MRPDFTPQNLIDMAFADPVAGRHVADAHASTHPAHLRNHSVRQLGLTACLAARDPSSSLSVSVASIVCMRTFLEVTWVAASWVVAGVQDASNRLHSTIEHPRNAVASQIPPAPPPSVDLAITITIFPSAPLPALFASHHVHLAGEAPREAGAIFRAQKRQPEGPVHATSLRVVAP